jgi:hypothetical protein
VSNSLGLWRKRAVIMNKKLSELGFENANISNIARIEKYIPLVEKVLINNISSLKKLLENGFKPANISNILSGSGAKCAVAIKALVDNYAILIKIKVSMDG